MATNKAKEVQTNTPGWSAPPTTADVESLRGMVNGGDYATPIRNQYARAEQDLSRSYNNPLGAYTSADVRDKSMRSQKLDMQQSLGMDLADAAQENANAKFNRQATVAGLTSPQFYNAKSTSSQPFTGGDALSIGLGTGVPLLKKVFS